MNESALSTFHAPTLLRFGPGVVAEVGAWFAARGVRRVLVVCGPGATLRSGGLAAAVRSIRAAGCDALVFSDVPADPTTSAADAGASFFRSEGCDAVLAYGGGSPMDCAKGIAASVAENRPIGDFLGTGRAFAASLPPLAAIPTTAGTGSEVTNAAVFIKEERGADGLVSRKKMGTSGTSLFPLVAFVDPELHATMPPGLTADTGMDALTHAVEAYVSRFSTPVSDMYARESIRLVGTHLANAVTDGDRLDARTGMALASTLAGVALSQAPLGMVHGIAHPVGALGGLPHGRANAILLPFVMRECLAEAGDRRADVGRLLSGGDAPARGAGGAEAGVLAIARLGARIGIPANLAEAGLSPELLPSIHADALTFRRRPASPRAFTDGEIGDLVRRAYGERVPGASVSGA